ncbi:MAG: hypothetical protein ACREME_03890 [Gemmatimonadales bacterium]
MTARRSALALSLAFLAAATKPLLRTGTLVLHNSTWDRVQVEVRVGPSQTCSENDEAGTHTLRRDENWAVVSDQMICWRREQTPGDAAGGWTAWQSTRLGITQVRDVTL